METMTIFRPGLGVAKTWRAHGRFHRVPNEIACAGLRDQLHRYAGQEWTGFLLYEDGNGIAMPSSGAVKAIEPTLWNLLRRWSEVLNRELADAGHWVVAWSHDAAEARLLFRDTDGDLQVVVEIDEGVPKIFEWSLIDVLNQASAAMSIQRETVRALGADRPTIRLARGERPH